jgi:hypothetical protein
MGYSDFIGLVGSFQPSGFFSNPPFCHSFFKLGAVSDDLPTTNGLWRVLMIRWERIVVLAAAVSGSVFGGLSTVSEGQLDEGFLRSMRVSRLIFPSGYYYSFQGGSRWISDGSDYQAVQNAFGKWIQEPGSSIWAAEVPGRAVFTPGRRNGQNEIAWIGPTERNPNPWKTVLHLPDSMLAAAMIWVDTKTRRVVERDIYFNDVSVSWRTETDGEEGGYWVERVALHEIGHLFGLRDLYNPGQKGWEEWMGQGNEGLAMYGYSSRQDETASVHPLEAAALSLAYHSVPEPDSLPVFALAGALLFVSRRRTGGF